MSIWLILAVFVAITAILLIFKVPMDKILIIIAAWLATPVVVDVYNAVVTSLTPTTSTGTATTGSAASA